VAVLAASPASRRTIIRVSGRIRSAWLRGGGFPGIPVCLVPWRGLAGCGMCAGLVPVCLAMRRGLPGCGMYRVHLKPVSRAW